MTSHSHVMGGSTATQRRNCAGSYYYQQQIPEEPASEFALRGSMLHAAMELLITDNPKDMQAAEPLFVELLGQDMGFEGFEITQDLIDNKLKPALKAWFEIIQQWGINDYFIEQRVSLELVIPGAFGTADIIAKDKEKRLHLLDWKFGDGVPVEVKENDGAAFYAAAALYDGDEELAQFCKNVTGVVFHIVQPRIGSQQVYQSWETDEDWIDKWLDQSVAAIKLARTEKPPTKAGDWCKWCRAKAICPSFNGMASEALSKKPEAMTGTELAHALRQAKLLKMWISEIFKLAQRELEGGAALPGYKLVKKLSRRQWIDSLAAEKRLRSARVHVGDMYNKTLVSPAQLEKVKPNVYSRIAEEYVTMRSSGLTVVDDSDSRESVSGAVELLANALPERQHENEDETRTGTNP